MLLVSDTTGIQNQSIENSQKKKWKEGVLA
jgi:hypothetical protein